MKVLWFSSRFFSEEKVTGTATWLDAMADILMDKDDIELFNISEGNTKTIKKGKYKKIEQWQLPNSWKKINGVPESKNILKITEIISSIQPDVIHIWGTESYWGLLSARGFIKGNIILEIQGLISQIKNEFYGRLNSKELVSTIGLKEIIKPKLSLYSLKKKFEKQSRYELEMIRNHNHISTQSEWVRGNIMFINNKAKLIETYLPLRRNFISSDKWTLNKCTPLSIFTSISATAPYKGLHVLIDALALIKMQYPEVKLHIAGETGKGIRESGYTKFIKRKLKHYSLTENVIWLGPLNETQIVDWLLNSHVAVFPSFIESYGVAVAESLKLGIPTITSYAGALPEQGEERKSILFFPTDDVTTCAYRVHQIFSNPILAENISANALKINTPGLDDIAALQIKIYKEVNQF